MALENKLGLTSSAELAREEERISKRKALDLFEKGILDTLDASTTAIIMRDTLPLKQKTFRFTIPRKYDIIKRKNILRCFYGIKSRNGLPGLRKKSGGRRENVIQN